MNAIEYQQEIDRLAKLCEAKDKELQAAKAQIAMKDEALQLAEDVLRYRVNPAGHTEMTKGANTQAWTRIIHAIEKAATSESTEAWLREEKAKVLEDALGLSRDYSDARGNIYSKDFQSALVSMIAELRKNGGK